MALPVVALPTDVVEVAGQPVPVRGLSTAEVTKLSTYAGNPEAGEVFLLSRGCGVTEAEAQAWLEATDLEHTGPVLTRIGVLSGLKEDPKSLPPGDGDGGS